MKLDDDNMLISQLYAVGSGRCIFYYNYNKRVVIEQWLFFLSSCAELR